MADDREISIVIKGTNLSADAFQKAREQIAGLKKPLDDANTGGASFAQQFLGAKNVASLFSDQVKTLVSGFTIASMLEKGVGKIVEWTSAVYDNATALVNQREKTGASIEWLQKWQEAAKKSNIDADGFSNASVILGQTLQEIAHGGGGDAVKALKDLGLSFEDLKGKTPEEKLDIVIRALANMTDVEQRNYDGKILLSKAFKEISQGLGGYSDAVDHAVVQSEGQVVALHAQKEAVEALERSFQRSYTNQLGLLALVGVQLKNTATGHDSVKTAMGLSDSAIRTMTLGMAGLDDVMAMSGVSLDAIVKKSSQLNDGQKHMIDVQLAAGMSTKQIANQFEFASASATAYIESLKPTTQVHTDFTAELVAARAAVAGLSQQQRSQIDAAIAMGKSDKDVAAQLNETASKVKFAEAAVKLYKDRLSDTKKVTDETTQKNKELREAFDRINESTQGVTLSEYEQITALKARNISEADIAKTMRLTQAQVTSALEEDKAYTDGAIARRKFLGDVEKFNTANRAKWAKEDEKFAIEKGNREIELLALATSTGNRLEQMFATEHDAEILRIKESETSELHALATKYDKTSVFYALVEGQIKAFYQHQLDLANGTAGTIEERMKAQGVYTVKAQADTVKRLKDNYLDMVASHKFSVDELQAAEKRWHDAQNAMNHQALLGFLGNFDKVLAGAAAFASGVGGKFGEVSNKIIGVVGDVSSMAQSFAKGDWVGGAIKGLNLLGKAVGAIFGTAGRDAVKDFAATFEGGFDGLHKQLGTLGAEGEKLWIKLTQGVDKNNPAQAKAVIDEVTAALAKGKQAATDMAAAFTEAQDKIGGALAGVTGKIGQQAQSQIDLTAKVTAAQKAYDDLVTSGASQDQIAIAAKNLAEAQAYIGKVTITTQDEFDRLSRIALNTFNTLVASGVSPIEAMQRIGGSVDDLIRNVGAFGLSGGAAYDQLARWRDLTTKNAPLLTQVGSLNDLMTMTTTLGGLNADVFKDMQAQGVDAYAKLTAAGFTSQEAETQMKPLLESIIKAHKDKGYAIDETTQKIIDQARENGVLTDDQLSTNDILMQGLGAMIRAVGGELPAAWQTMADKAAARAADIKTNAIDKVKNDLGSVASTLANPDPWQTWAQHAYDAAGSVQSDLDNLNFPTGGGGGGAGSNNGDGGWTGAAYASGGIAEGRQVALIAERGRREIVGDKGFMTEALAGAIDRLGGSIGGIGSGGAMPAINIQVNVDPNTGNVTGGLTRSQMKDLQRRVSGGELSIPAGSIGRTR